MLEFTIPEILAGLALHVSCFTCLYLVSSLLIILKILHCANMPLIFFFQTGGLMGRGEIAFYLFRILGFFFCSLQKRS